MEGLCPCGHEPTGSIVPVSQLVDLDHFGSKMSYKVPGPTPICVAAGFTVYRLALNLYNSHDRQEE